MKRYIFMTALLLACASLPAQDDAKETLAKMEDAFRKEGGIRADFTLRLTEQGTPRGESTGTISLKGERFLLETPDNTLWFDGKTLWSYLPDAEEVTVSLPGQEELQSIHPYLLLKSARKNYRAETGAQVSFNGKTARKLILTPAKENRDGIMALTVYVEQTTFHPLYIEILQNNGMASRLTITRYEAQQDFADSLFVFNPAKYPNAEIVDLR